MGGAFLLRRRKFLAALGIGAIVGHATAPATAQEGEEDSDEILRIESETEYRIAEGATEQYGGIVFESAGALGLESAGGIELRDSRWWVTYTDETGVVQTEGLREAVDDWRAGSLTTERLRTAIDSWRTKEPIST